MKRVKGAFLFLLVFSLARFQPLVCTHKLDDRASGPRIQEASEESIESSERSSTRGESRKPAGRSPFVVPTTYQAHPLKFLSRAPIDSLSMLKGIGPVLAERIVRIRSGMGPFNTWKDLLIVRGIGLGKVLELKKQAGKEE